MKKSLVLYFSRTGNNKFIAEYIAQTTSSELEQIKLVWNLTLPFVFFTVRKKTMRIKKLNSDFSQYQNIIICSPVIMGNLPAPVRKLLQDYKQRFGNVYFVSCCGSSREIQYEKYGHGFVFDEVRGVLGEKCKNCFALPVGVLLPAEKQKDGEAIMKARVNAENFTELMESQLKEWINTMEL